ncbi:MAG TPA: winged helix-turn-helix domain-containing protein [Terriglobales bacterium]|nr:winged helix-turn-helix domain-containing protein [Terriglobales bacterium]
MKETVKTGRLIRFGSYEVNLRSGELCRDGERVRLPEQSFQILAMLVEHPGDVVMRQEIQKRLWPNDTVVEFENSINAAVKRLRVALEDSADAPRYVETLARRGYRWMAPVEWVEAIPSQIPDQAVQKHLWKILTPIAAFLLLGVSIWWWWRSGLLVSAARLTDKDTIVLADFANSTGDPIFDETLRPALRSSLQQSPFLNILSDHRVGVALKLMTKPADARLTPEIARDLCRREQSKAYIGGAIAALGSEYVIALKAVNCVNGTTLGEQQVTARSKENVLKVLGSAASRLREQLGESLASVAKFDIPFDQTTSSLEALREYERGMKIFDQDTAGGLPHLLRAIQIDPDFAMAYESTAVAYANMNQSARATEYFTKAFQLREHSDPRERLEIESLYYGYVTGELDKAAQSYHKTIESYPKASPSPYGNLGYVYSQQGDYENGLELAREVLRRYPAFGGEAYEGIAENLMPLHRFEEARQILQSAVDKKLDFDGVHKDLYALGFLSGDSHAMNEQITWLESKPEYANLGFSLESDTAAYAGQLRKASELTDRAVDSAVRSDNKEGGAIWRSNAALREAMFGNQLEARRHAEAALKIAPSSQHVQIQVALALAMAHESARARMLARGLAKQFPLDTQVQSMWLPTINAQLALAESKADVALGQLAALTPTELGAVPFNTSVSCLYPVYLRAEAYLQDGKGAAAAGEYQKILDHSGIVWNCPTGALARVGIARANVLEARTSQGVGADAARTRARNAYKEFLNLWKDADSEVPILKHAKAEYAKLQIVN